VTTYSENIGAIIFFTIKNVEKEKE